MKIEVDLADFVKYQHVPKVWGEEIWLTNNGNYCAKLLILKPDYKCSLHRHEKKDETFFILSGTVGVRFYSTQSSAPEQRTVLEAGDSFQVHPGVFHQFWDFYPGEWDCVSPAVILEVSTQHSDDDVERLEPSGVVEYVD